jgi:hypothetical protein
MLIQGIPQRRLVLTAFMASVALNSAMILMSVLAGVPGVGAFLVRIADALAAPPGLIAKRVFQPHEHSVWAFVAATAQSLIFSILFYGIAALLVNGGRRLATASVAKGDKRATVTAARAENGAAGKIDSVAG